MGKPKCCQCRYAGADSTLWIKGYSIAWPATLPCVNHPDAPGQIMQMMPSDSCRNFAPRPTRPDRREPKTPTDSDVRHIALTKGRFAIVDAADYDYLCRFKWHAKETRGRFYAATVIDGKSVAMHQLLMAPPPGMVVDHIDGNGLNNRRANLRICTPDENRRNTRPRRKSSAYLGVSRRGDKYAARIKHQGREYHLGLFATEIEAARARDAKARQLHGHYAWLNFPGEQ